MNKALVQIQLAVMINLAVLPVLAINLVKLIGSFRKFVFTRGRK